VAESFTAPRPDVDVLEAFMEAVVMGLTLADLARVGRDLELTDEQWAAEKRSRQEWIDRTRANDTWTRKFLNRKVAILLTSHQANRPYLKACVESHAQLDVFMCLAYDNYVDPEAATVDHNAMQPPKDVLDQIDMFYMGHYQTWGGCLWPWVYQLLWGARLLSGFEYIYCTNGDFIIEHPEGFWDLLKRVGEADILTSGPDDLPHKANTAGFFVKSSALLQIVDHLQAHLMPWDAYAQHTQAIGNAEGRFGRAIAECGLTAVTAPEILPPQEDMLREPGHGTWYEVMGFRHIHSEHNHAYRRRKIPPHHRYLDPRFLGDEYRMIQQYHETQDTSVLEGWWAQGAQ
jgi:hypothetical protein